MKIIEKEMSGRAYVLSATAAAVILLAGIALAIFFASLTPAMTGITVGVFTLYTLAAILPIVAGAIWLGTLYRRKSHVTGRPRIGGGVFFGIIMILAGILLLCLYTGAISPVWKPVIISWQMLLILIGIVELGKVRIIWGSILTSTGVFFLIPKLIAAYPDSWAFTGNFVHIYWPVLLIISGLIIVFGLILSPTCCRRRKCRGNEIRNELSKLADEIEDEFAGEFADEFTGKAKSENGTVDYNLIFNGLEQTFLDPEFRGGNISNVFAGLELDLRRASLPEGVTYLKIELVFAGATIYVPSDWKIEIRSHSVMGAFVDKRLKPVEYTDDNRKLVIIANCVLGGGEVK